MLIKDFQEGALKIETGEVHFRNMVYLICPSKALSFLRAISGKNCSRAPARRVLSTLGDPACWPSAAWPRSCAVAADHAPDGSAPGRTWAGEQFYSGKNSGQERSSQERARSP